MEYQWEVTSLKSNQSGGVVQTYWKKTGTDQQGNEGSFSGATPFEVREDSDGYTPFDELTESVVLEWIKAVVVGDYEDHVNGMIQRQIDEQSITEAKMPWVKTDDLKQQLEQN